MCKVRVVEVGRFRLIIRSVVTGFHTDLILTEEGASLRRSQNALDEEGVELSMGLVVGWPTTTPGGVVAPELELAGIRHGVHEASLYSSRYGTVRVQ